METVSPLQHTLAAPITGIASYTPPYPSGAQRYSTLVYWLTIGYSYWVPTKLGDPSSTQGGWYRICSRPTHSVRYCTLNAQS